MYLQLAADRNSVSTRFLAVGVDHNLLLQYQTLYVISLSICRFTVTNKFLNSQASFAGRVSTFENHGVVDVSRPKRIIIVKCWKALHPSQNLVDSLS
jgi:hypothetical protein